MKTRSYTDDIVPHDTANLINAFLKFEETNFIAQAKFLDLDPNRDFRYVDLSFVDFSDCNLYGFDFTGANLQGTYGLNVIGTPILDKADTSDSLFSHELSQKRYFKEHPEDLATVERLATDYWANTVLRVEGLLQKDKGKGSSIKIASAVFENSKDPTVRTNVLLFMSIATENASEHKAFIYNTLARYANDNAVVLSGVRALSVFYDNHKDAFNWLVKFLSHSNLAVRRAAFIGVARSNKFSEGLDAITPYILACSDGSQRRAYVGRVAGIMRLQSEAYDWSAKRYYDFAEPITEETIRSWRTEDFEDFRAQNHKLKLEAAENVYRGHRLARLKRIGEKFGFAFRFEKKTKGIVEIIELGRSPVLESSS